MSVSACNFQGDRRRKRRRSCDLPIDVKPLIGIGPGHIKPGQSNAYADAIPSRTFSSGQNISIDGNGVISTTASGTLSPTALLGSAIGSLQVVSSVTAEDLVPISQAGTDHAVPYANFLDGITIDEAPAAGPSADSDTIWLAQSTNVMGSQSSGAIWVWIAGKLPTYKLPVVEITTSTNLDTTVHNGRFLVCSQPVTLTPLAVNMGSGFTCQVINLSAGNVTLGGGFLTSTGSSVVGPQQTVAIWCLNYSGGTVVYALMPQLSVAAPATPGQVIGLATTSVTATAVVLTWQQPSSGGTPSLYTVQFRSSGSTVWTVSSAAVAGTSYLLSGLQPSSSYDIEIAASNQGRNGYSIAGPDNIDTGGSSGVAARAGGRSRGRGDIEFKHWAFVVRPDGDECANQLYCSISDDRLNRMDFVDIRDFGDEPSSNRPAIRYKLRFLCFWSERKRDRNRFACGLGSHNGGW